MREGTLRRKLKPQMNTVESAARFWTAVIPTRWDEVTALAWAAHKTPKLAADTAAPTQSGDSEDSVATVQDARAPTCFALGSWSRCVARRPL